MYFWLCSGILPETRRAIPRAHAHQHQVFLCKHVERQINMREQSRIEHQLPVLNQQTIAALMCQTLDRQEVELLQWQIQAMADWTGAATSGVYRLAGTGRDHDREGGWAGGFERLCDVHGG